MARPKVTLSWKRCNRCGEDKHVDEFYKWASEPRGLSAFCIPCMREHNRKAQQKYRESAYRSKNKWREAHAHVYAAHRVVRSALLSGNLTRQPCSVCGSVKRIHAHHDDYSKPLDVIWLCPVHHRERHAWLKEQGRDPATTTAAHTIHQRGSA